MKPRQRKSSLSVAFTLRLLRVVSNMPSGGTLRFFTYRIVNDVVLDG